MTKEIQLTQGKVALVDDADFDWLNQWKWTAHKDRFDKWYARRLQWTGVIYKTIYMHRLILNASKGAEVDHKDGDGLHNCRRNLRESTHKQNSANQKAKSNTGYKGVILERGGRYSAHIYVNRKHITLGRFNNPIDAARAYDEAARKNFGEFAHLNFPE
jgi:hypothetical protein